MYEALAFAMVEGEYNCPEEGCLISEWSCGREVTFQDWGLVGGGGFSVGCPLLGSGLFGDGLSGGVVSLESLLKRWS